MYKNVCHKIIVYVLVGCLSFSVPATTYYNSVHAIEFLGGALAFEEALKWLLALVGVTAAGSVASQVDWSEVREQCVEVQLHNGASQAQVSEWWAKLARGTLDKASSCWSSFLEWSQSLTTVSEPDYNLGSTSFEDVASYLDGVYGLHIKGNSNFNSYKSWNVNSFILQISPSGSYTYKRVYFSTGVFNVYVSGSNVWSSPFNLTAGNTYNNGSFMSSDLYTPNGTQAVLFNSSSSYIISGNVTGQSNLGGYDVAYDNYFSGSGSVTSDWQSAIDVAKQNLQVLNRDLPDENANEVAIPMPGLADSDDEASADAYDNIIDAINDGTITLDDGIAQIQDLLHVLVIDDTTDIVQPVRPDPDTGEDQTKEDVIKENKSNMGFTLAGLEKVFPFCIPFDIYAFMTLLVAEPVAPEFDFPIKSVNNQTEEIHIDLSPFEPVAVVVRYIFDFLFIIGLALMTRSLIGGGSSD